MTTPDPRLPDTDPFQALAAVAASAFKAGGAYERFFGAIPDGSAPLAGNTGTDLGKFLDRAIQEGPAIMTGLLGAVSDMLSPDRPSSAPAPSPVPTGQPTATPPSAATDSATDSATDVPASWSVLFPAAQPVRSAPMTANWAVRHPLPWDVHVHVPQLVVDANSKPVGMMDTPGVAAVIVAAMNIGAVNFGKPT